MGIKIKLLIYKNQPRIATTLSPAQQQQQQQKRRKWQRQEKKKPTRWQWRWRGKTTTKTRGGPRRKIEDEESTRGGDDGRDKSSRPKGREEADEGVEVASDENFAEKKKREKTTEQKKVDDDEDRDNEIKTQALNEFNEFTSDDVGRRRTPKPKEQDAEMRTFSAGEGPPKNDNWTELN